METTIYKVPSCIFLPTSKAVEENYLNGKKGEQLWEQVIDNKFTGNMWTKKEILSLNPEAISLQSSSI